MYIKLTYIGFNLETRVWDFTVLKRGVYLKFYNKGTGYLEFFKERLLGTLNALI